MAPICYAKPCLVLDQWYIEACTAAGLGSLTKQSMTRANARSLLDAVRNNLLEVVQEIIASDCGKINDCDNQHNTPLILAASKGSVTLVKVLLAAGADASRQNSSGHTALTRACAAGKVEVVQLLLQAPNPSAHMHLRDNHGNSALLWCARTGNPQLCRLLLEAGANVNQTDSSGRTAIFHACVAGSAAVAELLISAGADLSIRDSAGKCAIDYVQNSEIRDLLLTSVTCPGSQSTSFNADAISPFVNSQVISSIDLNAPPGTAPVTPPTGSLLGSGLRSRTSSSRPSQAFHALISAIQTSNQTAVAAVLASPGVDLLLAQRDMLHNSVLHEAASRGSMPIMSQLLQLARQYRMAIDEPNMDGHTPLYLACSGGHRGVVQMLLGAGASPNVASREASTPLHACAAGGHGDIVRLLLDRGAQLNAADSHANTALLRAADLGHSNVCSILLRQGASINHRRSDGSTALLIAVRGGRVGVVQLLLAAGANPNIPDNDGETPLIEASTAGATSIVQTLVSHGVDVQACNHIGETALMRASVHRDATIVEELVAVGARLDEADRELGFTALMYAASQGSTAVVGRLLAAGASVGHANNMGISALLLASRSGYLEVVEQLLQAGASIDQADLKGYTPLMVACVGGYTPVVMHLLRAGADVNMRNYEGYTALSAAMEFGQKAVAELLMRHGADATAITNGTSPGYGQSNGNGSLKAAAGAAAANGTAANGGGHGGGMGAGMQDGSGPLNSTPLASPFAQRHAASELSAVLAGRAAASNSLHIQLPDGLPNSVSGTNLAPLISVDAAGNTAALTGPLLNHAAKFLHELDAYEMIQRRNSKNSVALSAREVGSGVAQPGALANGNGTVSNDGGPAASSLMAQQRPNSAAQSQANAGFAERTSHASTISENADEVATTPDRRAGPASALKGGGQQVVNGRGSSPSPPRPLFRRPQAVQPEDLIVLDPDGPDLFEPGMIYRSPWAKIVSFRDPCAEDVIWYEPSEADETEAGRGHEGAGGGCGCVIS